MALCCGLFQVVMAKDTSEVFRFLVYLACVLIQTYNMSYIGDVFIDHVSSYSFNRVRPTVIDDFLLFSELKDFQCNLRDRLAEQQQGYADAIPANHAEVTEASSNHWIGFLRYFTAQLPKGPWVKSNLIPN